ncbi:MAG: protein TolR [Methylococcales bacterium]|nr:protein TolR [Methylococcales bacterium]
MRKSRRRKPMAEINVVPYIDVTLVLLIIFMITTPMLQTGVQVELPQEASAPIEQKEDTPPIIVSINAQGQYYLKVDNQTDEPIQPEAINARVVAVLANKPATPVLINADNNVDYGFVVTVMAALKNAGVLSVGLMTKPEDK